MNIKNSISVLCLVLSCILVIFGCNLQPSGSIKVTLKGVVIDRPQSTQLILQKQSENTRWKDEVLIPIINGRFEYVLICDNEELYNLAFYEDYLTGSYRMVEFFSEHSIINFTLHPSDQYRKNIVQGGKLNMEYQDYFSRVLKVQEEEDYENELFAKVEQYLEDNYSEVLKKHNATENDLLAKIELLSEEGFDIFSVIETMGDAANNAYNEKMLHWNLQYAKEHPNIVGYSVLLSQVRFIVAVSRGTRQFHDISPFLEVYQTIFEPNFPDHPYTAQMVDLVRSTSFAAGVPFIDFSAIDFSGNPIKLSDRILGKPTVLHLWASWCGPCRQKGRELIPVYEEFRDKGFVVIGVARERNIAAAQAAIQLDKYPWENLVELNDAEQIWNKYGIGNAGGSHFLIDVNGKIIAIAPSIEEIRNFLKTKL